VILSNEESCLVYEKSIPDDGLLWDRLVAWWQEKHCPLGIEDQSARKSLGERLQTSLQSDAERNLFRYYFTFFRPELGPALPALIPQVYLHLRPGNDRAASPRQAPSPAAHGFLLLLPYRNRVVIEVDGAHHFSDPLANRH
jgi:hypothetical protein